MQFSFAYGFWGETNWCRADIDNDNNSGGKAKEGP
jgi:hypothetical protein